MISVPLGTLEYNGRPHGLSLIAKAGQEAVLLRFMEVFHDVFSERPEPVLGL
jgi:amidase